MYIGFFGFLYLPLTPPTYSYLSPYSLFDYFTIYLLGICAIALPFLLLASSTKACDITEKAWVPTSEVLSCHVKSCYRMLSKPLTWVFMNTTTGLGRALLYCIEHWIDFSQKTWNGILVLQYMQGESSDCTVQMYKCTNEFIFFTKFGSSFCCAVQYVLTCERQQAAEILS